MLRPAGNEALLTLDPDLGAKLDADDFSAAEATIRVALLRFEDAVSRGKWELNSDPLAGLLVVEGALLREVRTARRVTAELIGPGDLIRPFEEDGEEDLPVRAEIIWRTIQPTTLAVIDNGLIQVAARWPGVVTALVARAVRRSQRLSVNFSISHMVRIADRLLLLFWHLASQWGRMTRDGAVIGVPLTHSQLALMVGSERPSVTTALGYLSTQDLLERLGDRTWLLKGPMPDDIKELLSRSGPLAQRAEA